MKIVSSKILQCARDRYFGRVEAWVALEVQYHPLLPKRRTTVLASADAVAGDLRDRILSDAKRVAVLLHRFQRWENEKQRSKKIAA